MKIKLASLFVRNQQHAQDFYTNKLGFAVKMDIPMGEYKWLTIVSPEEPEGVELLLEPMAFAPAREYQEALFASNIPAFAFLVDDVEKEYQRLLALDVTFIMPPTNMGSVIVAILDDTCGNCVQLYQMLAA